MSVSLEKLTPIECLEQGYPLTMAQQMNQDDLTRDDCVKLLESGFEQYIIRQHYNFSAENWVAKMKEWDLLRRGKSWDFRSDRSKKTLKEPVQNQEELAWDGVDPNKKEVEITARVLAAAAVQKEEPKALIPADLTRETAERLLAEGVSKPEIGMRYGYANAPLVYAQLTRWGLHIPAVKVRKVESARPAENSELEERIHLVTDENEPRNIDNLTQGRTPIGEVVHQVIDAGELELTTKDVDTPPPTINLAAWESVGYASHQRITTPYLLLDVHGNGVIRNTDLQPGGHVQFRIDPEGRQIAVIPTDEGQLLFNEHTKQRRFTGGRLAKRLKAKEMALPARFRLDWNERLGAWVGQLVEKAE